jgi:hypothetical protein
MPFAEPEDLSPFEQESATVFYPEIDISSSRPYTLIFLYPLLI